MGFNSPFLTCAGPGGGGVCRSQSPVTHIREDTIKNGRGEPLKVFSLECANCARKTFPDKGIERLPPARRLTPEELKEHQRQQREGYEYNYHYDEHDWDA